MVRGVRLSRQPAIVAVIVRNVLSSSMKMRARKLSDASPLLISIDQAVAIQIDMLHKAARVMMPESDWT
jgi:hypothetical protein